jgi:hypothetical protein
MHRFLLTWKGKVVEEVVELNAKRITSLGISLAGGEQLQSQVSCVQSQPPPACVPACVHRVEKSGAVHAVACLIGLAARRCLQSCL